jgi:hypothetical protein
MASPRERADRMVVPRGYQSVRTFDPRTTTPPGALHPGYWPRHHFHDRPPWPHQHYGDYVFVDGGLGWWPRWFPYWDEGWRSYWWGLYDYYGGDAYPDYATYARDAIIRQQAPQWGLIVSGALVGAAPHHGGGYHFGGGGHHFGGGHHDFGRARYPHPHDRYRDYTVVDGLWWPRWFPYGDPTWRHYWDQLYVYYGGDTYPDYAHHARDAHVRGDARRRGWW